MARWLLSSLLVLPLALLGPQARGDYAFTDLVDAAKRGDYHAARTLLGQGSDPAVTDAQEYTALHWAGIRGHWRIFRELLKAGAPVGVRGGDGGTPLHWTCHHDQADMVKLLLDAGADVAVQNRWGRTALHVAARRGNARVAALLLDHGADPNTATREGWTPLHVAYRSGQAELAALLEERGADPGRLDSEGAVPADTAKTRPEETALDAAALAEFVGIYELGGGGTVRVWLEEQQLRIREFAPDTLYPVGKDRFFCRQEPWPVQFTRNQADEVVGIELGFLRRAVQGERKVSPQYVGSRVCQDCHVTEEQGRQYITWMASRHAHAYWRLGADWALFLAKLRPYYQDLDSPMEDVRCLQCHVTAAQDPDALVAATYRPEEGVGCESCHGPGSEYIDPEVMADRQAFLASGGQVPDPQTCRGCHRNSERFDFSKWWPKIAHPKPVPATEGDHAAPQPEQD